MDTSTNANEVDYGDNLGQNLQVFSLTSIVQATNNFMSKLGEGGFGPVYKVKMGKNFGLGVLKVGFLDY